MRFKLVCAFLSGVIGAGAAARASAQSLADVAKKEEERRKEVQAGKVYTNDDLKPGLQPTGPSPAAAGADAAVGKDPDGAKDAKDPKDARDAKDPKESKDSAKDSGGPKDQKYWADRHKAIAEQIDRDTGYADAMQARINALTTDFVNRDDPAQRVQIERDRQRAVAELERLRKQIQDGRKALADLEEEARRAGVPAGWLR